MKYKINKEFFPFSHFKPPISEKFLAMAVPHMKPPKSLFKDKALETRRYEIESYDGKTIECFLLSPKALNANAPCLIYIHGGGFVLAAAGYHYKNAMRYAKEVGCKVLFVNYRLAPKNPHPVFFEDCYAAATWAYDNAKTLQIDSARIAISGDSAGSTLAVGVCMMAKERQHPIKFLFQMLPYPFLDARNNSDSCKKYTDTPMWNSKLSKRIAPMTNVCKTHPNYLYYSPVEADNFSYLPPAYIETAEFDCLHDDGILYAEKLRKAGVDVLLNETKGTMHGFDIMQKAKTTQKALTARIEYMKKFFIYSIPHKDDCMNNVNKTLYIPLYGKAYVSRKGLFLSDKKAEEIWAKEGFSLKGKSKSKWLAYYMGVRSAVFDEWLKEKMSALPNAVILHIGCGLDSRCIRVGTTTHKWYDVDFLEVIEERKRYYTPSDSYQMLAGDARDCSWLKNVKETACAIVVMEGVSMYLTKEELQRLTNCICAHFEQAVFLFDCYSSFAAKASKYKNPVNDVGVTKLYGIDNPEVLQNDTLSFVTERTMIPKKYIDELRGVEKFVFARLYAGGISKKLYRLFEYKKK